ncbi:MAG: hypothetical protein JSR72_07965 [Proteobacteria bacterium]|nr:hypothetical protein [Pseudomonadota bacterium]
MLRRIAIIVAAVIGSLSVSQAADLGGSWSGGGGEAYCGSDMIAIYDSQPGVVTRRWRPCKDCDRARDADRFRHAQASIVFAPYPPFMEPWRRW